MCIDPLKYTFVSPNGKHWLGDPRPVMNIISELEEAENAKLVVCEDFEEYCTWCKRVKYREKHYKEE